MMGAGVTRLFKIEGALLLWEGEGGSAIVRQGANGNMASAHDLPFTVTLERFAMDTYPGTAKPSGYASFVMVEDKLSGYSFKSKIWMNHPLKYRGFPLFQSSYRREGDRQATVLTASKDPGQAIVFAGYVALMAGLALALAKAARASMASGLSRAKPPSAALLLFLLIGPPMLGQAAGVSPAKLAHLPVQHDGRAMPFDTYARDMVKTITGSSEWMGEAPVSTMTRWLDGPEGAANENNIMIGSPDLAAVLGLQASTKHASFLHLVQNDGLAQLLLIYEQGGGYGLPANKTVEAAFDLQKRLGLMKGILLGTGSCPIPPKATLDAAWRPIEAASAKSLAHLLDGPRLEGWPSAVIINREIFYNKLKPLRISWTFALFAVALSIAALAKKRKWLDAAVFSTLICSFGMMTLCIALRWLAGERVPAANMYESMLFLSWGLGLSAVVSNVFFRNRALGFNAAAMAALAMMLADLLPLDHFIRPVAPILAGTPWLAIHVPIIMAGYALLALGAAAAHLQVGAYVFCRRRPNIGDILDMFSAMLYWYNFIGSILLLAGILTGSMWAASSWGRYWGWDSKEVWSLVAFLAYMAIIHARAAGLIEKFGYAICSILAFQAILMTYLGVNYVLATGMHSYGMGDSPMALWLLIVAAAEIVFVGVAVYFRASKNRVVLGINNIPYV
jgi:ABC-type transport system involved in cytochrome c biogenesis permease subunit